MLGPPCHAGPPPLTRFAGGRCMSSGTACTERRGASAARSSNVRTAGEGARSSGAQPHLSRACTSAPKRKHSATMSAWSSATALCSAAQFGQHAASAHAQARLPARWSSNDQSGTLGFAPAHRSSSHTLKCASVHTRGTPYTAGTAHRVCPACAARCSAVAPQSRASTWTRLS